MAAAAVGGLLAQVDRPQHQIAHRRHRQRAFAGPRPVADQQRPVRRRPPPRRPWLPRTSVGSSGTTSNSVRKPSFFCEQPPGRAALRPAQLRVEEQLARVVARLAVDVDRPGVVRGAGGRRARTDRRTRRPAREQDQLARPLVVAGRSRARSSPARTRATPGSAAEHVAHPRHVGRVARRRRGRAGGRRRRRPGWRTVSSCSPNGPRRTASSPASRSTRFGSTGRDTSQWPYSLTTQTRAPTAAAASSSGAQASSSSPTSRGHVAAGGPEPLRVVVEVRQVDERQVGPLVAQHVGGRGGDPLRARQPGHRPPEGGERERAELAASARRPARPACR